MSDACSPCNAAVREIVAPIPVGFRLQSGERLAARAVQARLVGPEHGPLVVVAGGISAGRRAASDADGEGWWAAFVRDGGPIDTRRLRVLTFDFLPDVTVKDIPTITTTDQARLLALVLDFKSEARIDAFVGASYGGCVALAFAETFPERVGELVVISAAHRTHPLTTALRGIQRRILQQGIETGREVEAIDLARQLAMTTYRSPEEFDQRFGDAPAPERAGGAYAVCDYLKARGAAYPGVTSARRWIALSDSLDRHSVSPERIEAPLTLIGFDSDRLAPIEDLRALAARVPNLSGLFEGPSLYGHDAFLKETEVVSRLLQIALSSLSPKTAQSAQEIAA